MENEVTKVRQIGNEVKVNSWINLEVKVVNIWEAKSGKIAQTGLFGDDTGTIKFTSWKVSNLPEFEQGKCYLVESAVVNSWNGKLQLNLNRKTKIEEIDKDIEVQEKQDETIKGEIIGITDRTGAIMKCSKCSRALTSKVCPVHKDAPPKKDIRVGLKVKADTGDKVVEFRGRDAQKLTGFSPEEAHQYDIADFIPDMERKLVGKTVEFTCTESRGFFYGKKIQVVS